MKPQFGLNGIVRKQTLKITSSVLIFCHDGHEKWVEVYQSALLELEHSLMTGRLVDARAEIVARVEKLRELPGLHSAERHAIDDALKNLCVLEQEEVRYAAEQQSKAAQRAPEKLRSMGPTIERLQSGQLDGR